MLKRVLIGLVCLMMAATPLFALAEQAPEQTAVPEEAEVVTDFVEDDGMSDFVADVGSDLPSVAGMTPLYTTKATLPTSSGTSLNVRAQQSKDSASMGVISRGDVVTIYMVYPSWVLIECDGIVGYIQRTCISENCTTLDPTTTPPYGVQMMKYVATTTDIAPVYTETNTSSETFPIVVGAGSRVAILDFADGFAKVLYWRSYGYIEASKLTDLKIVSATDEPMSDDTPIAAFTSFFKYNNGSELNDGRVKNIVRSCELMTRVMQPGEQLDFNAQIGPYKRTNGYYPAPVLIDGGSQPGYGGGTCQSSSTLYNTVRQLPGITIVMRRPHGPGCARYLPMHQDAAVGNDALNFIFRNDYDFPISVVAESTGEGTLTIQIFKVQE